jgi:hypothetical protein
MKEEKKRVAGDNKFGAHAPSIIKEETTKNNLRR